MNVSVFGLGYVGSVTAACLASKGHKVVGVDVNADKVNAIKHGQSPVLEPGLDCLIRDAISKGNLLATQDAAAAVAHGDVSLVCVGTPSDPNGNLNFADLDRVYTEIGRALAGMSSFKVITLRSTVLPGTLSTRLLPLLRSKSGKQEAVDFGAAANPEFLREGSGVTDFNNPPFTIIGQTDSRAGDMLAALYSGISAPIFRTDPDTACMVKYASNAFHALKVTFAGEIGELCKRTGVDGTEVMKIFCQDTHLNISPRYLRPGFAFGGSCLPKDLRALLYLARHSDVQAPVIESILPSNRLRIQRAVELILQDNRRNVGIIGLSFKPGTDDLRESPIVDLVETLIGKGLRARIYDQDLNLSRLIGSNRAFIERAIPHISGMVCASLEEVVESSDIIVVAHDPREGRERLITLLKPGQLLVDFVKIVSERDQCFAAYKGICW